MASTVTLQNSVDFVKPFVGYLPVTAGVGSEPAITCGNIIQQTILSAPFAWKWNRNTTSFSTSAADHSVSLADFGYLESGTASATANVELLVRQHMPSPLLSGRPDAIAAQLDDNAGNITFRLSKIPDATYTVTVDYQKKVSLFSNLSQTWAIPDQYGYIYQRGFLAMYYLYAEDQRFQATNMKFVTALLGAAEGLSETQRNTFLNNWLSLTSYGTVTEAMTQQGRQALGV